MKKNLPIIIVFIVGMALLAYPTIGNVYNVFHQTKLIATYNEDVKDLDKEKKDELWQNAIAYNKKLQKQSLRLKLTPEEEKDYLNQLNINSTGMMGYVEVPDLKLKITVFHGTSEGVLRKGAGHITGTSLPTGGKGNHPCISAHTGLPSAKLFSDLHKIKRGNIFIVTTLDHKMTYEVDQIVTVLPDEIKVLERSSGEDLCTLMTCTPYGVNSHRLMVRGHRIPNIERETETDYTGLYILIAMAAVTLGTILLLFRKHLRRKKQKVSYLE